VEDVVATHDRIAGGIYGTPCIESIPLSALCGEQVFCKLEAQQRAGSFKERRARNALMLLSQEQKQRGGISASAPNDARDSTASDVARDGTASYVAGDGAGESSSRAPANGSCG
jgi:threonine dehydratase